MEYFEFIGYLVAWIENINYWALLVSAGAIYLVFYVLQGIGLYTLSKRAGIRQAWISFVPFLNNIQIGRLAGTCSLFGQKVKNGGIYCAVSEGLYCVSGAISLVSQIVLRDYYNPDTFNYIGYPESLAWANIAHRITYYATSVLYIVYSVFLIVLLFGFFRKYAARNAALFVICSVFFPVKGAFIFAVRKNVPVDYERYMRARREAYYRRQQQYYNGNNPYGRPPYNSPSGGGAAQSGSTEPYPADPFEEFSNDASSDKERKKENSDKDEFFG